MKKLQTHLTISYFAVSLLIMCILLSTFYLHIRQQVMAELKRTHLEIADHTGSTIDSMTNMLLFALSDGPFQRQFKSVLNEDMDKDPYEALQFQNEVAEMFTNYSDTYQNLQVSYYVTLYGFNRFHYCSMDHFDFDAFISSDFCEKVLEANGKVAWDTTREDPYLPTSSKNVYTMGRAIKSGKNYAATGILAVVITEESLYRIYRSGVDSEKDSCFIIGENGQIISARDKGTIGTVWNCPIDLSQVTSHTAQTTGVLDGQDTLFSFRRLTSSNWWLVETIPLDVMLISRNRLLSTMGVSLLCCLFFSFLLSFFLSRKLSRPISQLGKGIDNISKGDLSLTLPSYPITEFNLLIQGYNRMAANIRQLIETVRQKEIARTAAEVRFLQVQINPHFIYNTLNSIRCMILMGENQEAADIMVRMISLMRNVLSTGKTYVTLREELKNLENYLEIEKIVYYDELSWQIELAPNIHTALIPKLILQPLVENSIFHGIVPNRIKGVIRIKAWPRDSVLHITITDNGILSPEKREELKEKLTHSRSEPSPGHTHIGLLNTHQRIQYLYGSDFGITLLPEQNAGTEFLLRIPVCFEPPRCDS